MDHNLHSVQIQILRELVFRPSAKFSDLNISSLSNDHFTFHIKRLIDLGLVLKLANTYTLSQSGKEYANRLDTDALQLERQAKTSTLIVCTRIHKNQTQYLISQRLKQPYYGFYGWIGGKKKWGESILECAARELLEETNCTADLKLVGIKHKRDYLIADEVQEDKFFFVIHAQNLQGELKHEFEGGRNLWLTKAEILILPDLFPDVTRSMAMVTAKKLEYIEITSQVTKY